MRTTPYPPIADYAIVGDCHTAALVARDGCVDWLCPRRFDAPAVFCRLLDAHQGGYLRTAPGTWSSTDRTYVGDTNVLQTEFAAGDARLRLTDLMPVFQRAGDRRGHDVGTSQRFLRLVEALGSDVDVHIAFKPTFDFARASIPVQIVDQRGVVARHGSEYLTLASDGVEFTRCSEGEVRASVPLRAGERRWIAVTSAEDPDRAAESLAPADCDAELQSTIEYWNRWVARCTYQGRYRQQVLRSALVLKLLTYEPTGAIVAAPTTSVPEEIGGARNWDYRFTWLRDASLILYALMTLGYDDEAGDFIHWLERTIDKDPHRAPQIMYGIDGRTELPERTLDHLEGYRHSAPVRIGNAAASQRQLDIYGEVLRAAALHCHVRHAGPRAAWPVLRGLVEQATADWQQAGHGIWEARTGPAQYTYGKLMCWAALDAGVKLASDYHLQAPMDKWCSARAEVRKAILDHAYDDGLGAFTQSFGSQTLDASSLVIPRIGFLPPADPRVVSTVHQLHARLTRHGLVYRYLAPDGLRGSEGTFTLCTFWLADALALIGEMEDAHAVFTRGLQACNDLGLLAEEVDPTSGDQLGNFPQGFSHLALIGAAVDLDNVERHGREDLRTPKWIAPLGLHSSGVRCLVMAEDPGDAFYTYSDLGVRPVINAAATLTRLGGSRMPPVVLDAMRAGAGAFVDLQELQRRVGERIADLTRNEACYVSSGAAAGIAITIAGLMAGCEPELIHRLPRVSPQPEVIIYASQRNGYDQAALQTGARIVEIGPELKDLETAFSPNTLCLLYFAGLHYAPGALPLQEVIATAHARGVPVLVDAAAQIPPVANLWHFTRELGADAAIFSGGKALRGPQSSGLVLGRRSLIDACIANGPPNHSLGRPMKVGKEELLGILAAVEWSLTQSEPALLAAYESTVKGWLDGLRNVPGLTVERGYPSEAGQPHSRAIVHIGPEAPVSRDQLVRALWDRNPRIAVSEIGDDAIALNPQTIEPGEAQLVLEALRELVA